MMTVWLSNKLIKTDMGVTHITGLVNRLFTTFIASHAFRLLQGTEVPTFFRLCPVFLFTYSSGPLAHVRDVHAANVAALLGFAASLRPHKSIDIRDIIVYGHQNDTLSC
jgi:hypothetical protein